MKYKLTFFIFGIIFLVFLPFISADSQTVFQPGDMQTIFAYSGDMQGYFLPSYIPNSTLTIVNPTGTITASSTTIYFILSQPGTCNYSINSGSNVSISGVDNLFFTTSISTPQPNGNYVFNFTCLDLFGNRVSNSTTITTSISTTTPDDGGDDGGGGGGGGGGGETTNETIPDNFSFTVEPDFLKVDLKIGDNIVYFVTVSNVGNKPITIRTNQSDFLDYFLVLGETNFTLNPGESKRVSFGFFAREESEPNLYTESVDFIYGSQVKRVNVILDIKEKNPIFDVLVDAPNKGYIGEKVSADIEILNFGDLEGFDLLLDYSILDLNGTAVDFKEESLFIEKSLNVKKSLFLNKQLKPGEYLFYANVSYEGITARGSDLFTVKYRKGLFVYYIFVGLIILIFLRILQLLYKKSKNPSEENVSQVPVPKLPWFKRILKGILFFLGIKKL